jgi:uncharacterized protein
MGRIFTDGVAVVAFYTALNALIILGLAIKTSVTRGKTQTLIGDGGKDIMMSAIRAHGNAVEYAPITLLVIGGLAACGASLTLLHVLGAGLTLSRVFHAAGLLKTTGLTLERMVGSSLSYITLLIGALALLFMSIAG